MAPSSSSFLPSNLLVLLGLSLAGVILMTRRLRRRVPKEDLGAFVQRLQILPPPPPPPPKAPHPLTGLTFAVADIFDIEGYVTGFGNPDWARTHEFATRTSPIILTLVDGGASCVGKTVIDELAYGISGENKHYDTPENPSSPERVPGGCSSGSAVAVASGLVDFSLGVDAVGGVRIPGGYCGILAFRPSYGVISNMGVIPVSPSLDTVGLFSKDPNVLHRVAHILLQLPYGGLRQPRSIIIADDCFELLKIPASRVTQVLVKSVEKQFGRRLLKHLNLGDYLSSRIDSLKHLQNGKKNDESTSTLLSLANAMRSLYNHEFRNSHDEWISSTKPVLDPFISAQINRSSDNTLALDCCHSARDKARLALYSLLKDDGILVLPTVLGLPPKLNAKEISSEKYLSYTFCLSSVASMSGCCQVTIPIGIHEKTPVSLSFIARHGADSLLLDTVKSMYAILQEQANIASKSSFSKSSISKEESAEIAKEKGNAAYKDKQWQKAINLYTDAIQLNEKSATYHSNRAAAYLELGSYLQAEADCTAAINLDKKNVKAYLRRGTAREMLGYYKEAIEDFKYALVLEPTNKTATNAVNRLKNVFP
ncbi:outer envelope protein 64, chloroplastic-like isoform X1 [Zingiber officinale]|uniref:outer envelope protein 64, chloroplastic-like isoform X1 n=1 Tax=Zingiber officinale TaxID=94328 RepID=UPI001C4DD781|nr:outer envelope protein 64, chloroplastic-like isoform X1 [Zingiber officinale]